MMVIYHDASGHWRRGQSVPNCVTVTQNKPGTLRATCGRRLSGGLPANCLTPLAQGVKCVTVTQNRAGHAPGGGRTAAY